VLLPWRRRVVMAGLLCCGIVPQAPSYNSTAGTPGNRRVTRYQPPSVCTYEPTLWKAMERDMRVDMPELRAAICE
jgi:hypothetical protein